MTFIKQRFCESKSRPNNRVKGDARTSRALRGRYA